MRRFSIISGFVLALAACGGSSSGLKFDTPSVEVEQLSGAPLVVKLGSNQTLEFTEDGKKSFEPIQDNKSYTLTLAGNENCSFWGKHHEDNDQRTLSATSKNASETFLVNCNVNSDGVLGDDADEDLDDTENDEGTSSENEEDTTEDEG